MNKLTSASVADKIDDVTASRALQDEAVWQDGAARFLRQVDSKFPFYCDILSPVHVSVHQVISYTPHILCFYSLFDLLCFTKEHFLVNLL